MTEEEAKTKWCPFARVRVAYGNTVSASNRSCGSGFENEIRNTSKCIASDCMAWRVFPITGMGRGEDLSSGYCGLAQR